MKKYFALLSALVMTGNMVHAECVDMAKAAVALFASGAAQYGAKKLSDNQTVRTVGKTVGMNPMDVGRVATLACGLWSMSFIAEKGIKKGLIELAWKAPIAALVVGATQTKTFQEIAQNVPIIGGCITCDSHDCQGVCNDCKLTKTVISLGMWRAIDSGISPWLKNKGWVS